MSTELFTAVLMASSRIYRPDLHAVLRTHGETIISRAVIGGRGDTSLIQALMIAVSSHSATDTTTWQKVGWAIRLGYQFRWHTARRRPLPITDHEKRLQLVSRYLINHTLNLE